MTGTWIVDNVSIFRMPFEEAIQEFDQAIEFYDLRIEYLISVRKLDLVAKLKPSHALANNTRGSVYHEMEDIEKAIDNYSEAALINPNLGEAFFNRGTEFALMGKIRKPNKIFPRPTNSGSVYQTKCFETLAPITLKPSIWNCSSKGTSPEQL